MTQPLAEAAANFTAGGFSNYFGTPDYQASAVTTYLQELGDDLQGLFNTSGRGYPDVSALGVNIMIAAGGEFGAVDGSSAASPIFASVVSLVNDARAVAGKSPLGFLNPFLYANPGIFNDITNGE